jgi:hypothetical protein
MLNHLGCCFLFLKKKPSNLFVGTLSGKIYLNTPHTAGWQTRINGLTATTIYSLLSDSGAIFAGTDEGIYAIPKGDSVWHSADGNLTAGVIRTIAANGNYLYVGTDSGVWYRPLSDFVPPTYVAENSPNLPAKFQLDQNYPNPFNPSTTISYAVNERAHVTLKVYDILGREIQTLVNQDLSPGTYRTQFNAVNLSSGVYLYRIQTGSYAMTKKMILMR